MEHPGRARAALAAVLALPDVGVLVFDADLRYVLCGGEALGTIGYDGDAMLGRRPADLFPVANTNVIEPAYRAALAGRRSALTIAALDGTRAFRVEVVPLGDGLAMSVFRPAGRRDRSRRRELHFRAAFDDAAIGMALVGVDGGFLRVNDALVAMLGHDAPALRRLGLPAITHPADRDADRALREATLAGARTQYHVEQRCLRADGEALWVILSMSLLHDADGRPRHFIAQMQDISDRHALESRLKHLATHDPLTGAANRALLEERLAELHAGGTDAEHALIALDVDGFKLVNDTHGHLAGDAVLRHVATTLAGLARPADLVARSGGDEFVVLLPHTTVAAAEALAERTAAALAGALVRVDQGEIPVRVSTGVGVMGGAVGPRDALRAADAGMYRRKRRGQDVSSPPSTGSTTPVT